MAWSASGLFVATWIAQWGPANAGINLTAADLKLALWGPSVTPNYNSDTAYGTAPWNAGESSGAGYTAGGVLLGNPTLVPSAGSMVWDADNIQLDETTIESEGGIIYAPNKANRLLAGVWWGEPRETQDGTFLITWNALGIANVDLTP